MNLEVITKLHLSPGDVIVLSVKEPALMLLKLDTDEWKDKLRGLPILVLGLEETIETAPKRRLIDVLAGR